MSLDDVRRSYASKIGLRAGIRSERLLQALAEVPRERFLGPGPWIVAGSPAMKPAETPNADPTHIYDDVSVALDASQNLYNGAPGVLIPWINALDLQEGASVFHLGGGAGYYTAIIAKVVGARGRVVMAEVDEKLGSSGTATPVGVSKCRGDRRGRRPSRPGSVRRNPGERRRHASHAAMAEPVERRWTSAPSANLSVSEFQPRKGRTPQDHARAWGVRSRVCPQCGPRRHLFVQQRPRRRHK